MIQKIISKILFYLKALFPMRSEYKIGAKRTLYYTDVLAVTEERKSFINKVLETYIAERIQK